jgi:positive regulator of sigma E activity
MARYVAPWLAPLLAGAILASVLYGESVIDAAGVYGIVIVAFLLAAPGYARWDEHRHPRDP